MNTKQNDVGRIERKLDKTAADIEGSILRLWRVNTDAYAFHCNDPHTELCKNQERHKIYQNGGLTCRIEG